MIECFVVEGMGEQDLTNAERKFGRLKEEPSARPSLGQIQYGVLSRFGRYPRMTLVGR